MRVYCSGPMTGHPDLGEGRRDEVKTAKRRDPGKPKRKYDAKKRAPKLKRVEADA